jgi:NTE family protein
MDGPDRATTIMAHSRAHAPSDTLCPSPADSDRMPGQVVLVMQGGGALGAFQAGVYQALHEAGIEPDWVVGTSIGAINGVLIAGNRPERRLERLQAFWQRVGSPRSQGALSWFDPGTWLPNLGAVSRGVPGFFEPNPRAWLGTRLPIGDAAYYSTEPLRRTLAELTELDGCAAPPIRLTLGAVAVRSGRMRYFDSRREQIGLDHVLASGALPPAFPAVVIDGEPYWDGGIYSNTPIEVVMNDNPRRNSVIFAAELWQQEGGTPATIHEVIGRQKDIQYASRGESHTQRQKEIHHLRHIVRELGQLLPDELRQRPDVRELLGWGCGTVMHIVPLRAPALAGEDHTKDIDFTPRGISARWQAGYRYAQAAIAQQPWRTPIDTQTGIVVHEEAVPA